MITRKVKISIPNERTYKTYDSLFSFEDQKGKKIIILDFEMSEKWLISSRMCFKSKGTPIGDNIIIEYPCIFVWEKSIYLPIKNSSLLRISFERHVKECRENHYINNM